MLVRLHDVYVRGVGFFGQLGLNNRYQSAEVFTPIPTLQHVELRELKGSYCQSVALLRKNELLVWGWPLDVRSQMQVLWMLKDRTKLAKFIQRYSPMPWLSLREGIEVPERETEIRDKLESVDIGGAYMVACDDQGLAYGWGTAHRGQFGLYKFSFYNVPTPIPGLEGRKIVDVQCGYQHTLYLDEQGRTFGTGRAEYGTLGNIPMMKQSVFGNMKAVVELPIRGVKQIAAGQNHSVMMLHSGEVFACGKNDYGQCGDLLSFDRIMEPHRLYLPEPAKQIACGTKHTLILGQSGTLYGLGNRRLGQLDGFREGFHEDQCSATPVKVPFTSPIRRIQAGFDRSCAFLESGEVWVWGGDNFKYLGGEFYPDFTLLNDELPEGVSGEISHVGLGFMHTLIGVMVQASKA